ncbi:DNA polymerase IV [soil metagenome]
MSERRSTDTHPLNWLFVDMNSYFASVEQQLRPELRERPVAVAPVIAETTCAIAASYEARRYGIKTGTNIAEARRLCPGLEVLQARPAVYVELHHEIVAAVDSVLPIEKVSSIDEMYCRLGRIQRELDEAVLVAEELKQAIRERAGQFIRCSVGLAPNAFLAKLASNLRKPDGLSTITPEDLPHKLFQLSLRDLTGIGHRMEARLGQQGVYTVEQLYALSKDEMRSVWKGVLGERWWYALRGYELPQVPTNRRSLSHSHVLPPQFRTQDGAKAVLVRLIHKAAARLRSLGYWTRGIAVSLSYLDKEKWKASASLDQCQDTQTMVQALSALLQGRPADHTPLKVSVVLYDLVHETSMTPLLFYEDSRRFELTRAMDAVNGRFGANAVYLAAMHDSLDTAPSRISFTHIPDIAIEATRGVESRASKKPSIGTDISPEGLPA